MSAEIEKRDIRKEMFEFVQEDEKIFDQEFESKAIGYFQDAMIRFAKNKTNVLASLILLTIFLLSIFVPIFTSKNYTVLDENMAFLPPRVPGLERLGVANGISHEKNKPIDLETIDIENNFYGLPVGYQEDAIDMDSLSYSFLVCTDKVPECIGGEVVLVFLSGLKHMTVTSNDYIQASRGDKLIIDVNSIEQSTNSRLNVYVKRNMGSGFELVETIAAEGRFEIDLAEKLNVSEIVSLLRLEYQSDSTDSRLELNSISVESQGATIFENKGYQLSMYRGTGGLTIRQNGRLPVVSFNYDRYKAAFAPRRIRSFSKKDYDQIVLEYSDQYQRIDNPENPEGWLYREGFPIIEVYRQNAVIMVAGEEHTSYDMLLDPVILSGGGKIPYHILGTNAAGRDLFALICVGLRTSFLIGFLASLINITIGIIYGSISGYYGGKVDLLMQRFVEIIGHVPWLVTLAIAISILGPGFITLLVVLIFNGWVRIQGTTRMQYYRYKGREYVLAARTLGAKDRYLISRHILPNGIGTIITASILTIPGVIFLEAALSYLGFGVGHGQIFSILGVEFSGLSIGVLLADARIHMLNHPHLTLYPAIVISILMITFNMFGNALRDAFNPSLRGHG